MYKSKKPNGAMSIAAFADYINVSRQTIHRWKDAGYIVMDGRWVNVARTEELLRTKRMLGTEPRLQTHTKQVSARRTGRPPKVADRKEDDPFGWLGKSAPPPPPAPPEPDIEEDRRPGETDEELAARVLESGKITLSYNDARKMRENYEALLKKLKYDEEIKVLVPVAVVADAVGQAFAAVRTRLLALPAEQAPAVKRCKTVAEVQDLMTTLITDALEELSANVLP